MGGFTSPSIGIGVNQTINDVTASRSSGVTYYNTSASPILVIASSFNTPTQNCVIGATVDGISMGSNGDNNGIAGASYAAFTFVVPAGKSYSVSWANSQNKWIELK